MNKSAALKAVVGMEYSDALAEKAFLDFDTNGDTIYSNQDVKEIDLIAIQILGRLLHIPSFKQGDMEVKYDYKAIQASISALTAKYPVEFPLAVNAIPKVRARFVW